MMIFPTVDADADDSDVDHEGHGEVGQMHNTFMLGATSRMMASTTSRHFGPSFARSMAPSIASAYTADTHPSEDQLSETSELYRGSVYGHDESVMDDSDVDHSPSESEDESWDERDDREYVVVLDNDQDDGL